MCKRYLSGEGIAVLEFASDEMFAAGPGYDGEAIRPPTRAWAPAPGGEPRRRISRATNLAGADADGAAVRR